MTPHLNYELKTIQNSLFKDNALRKYAKAQLAKTLKTTVQPTERKEQPVDVIDGGALPYSQGKWVKKATYKHVVKQ